MRKHVVMAALVALTGCDTPTTPDMMEASFAVGGGNPHFNADYTWCSVTSTHATCNFKLVGLGKNLDAVVELEVNARQVYSCANPNGFISPGHSDQERVGSASGSYRSDRNGSIAGLIQAAMDWSVVHGNAPACPASHTLVPGSVADEVSWQLSATGSTKGGTFRVTFPSP